MILASWREKHDYKAGRGAATILCVVLEPGMARLTAIVLCSHKVANVRSVIVGADEGGQAAGDETIRTDMLVDLEKRVQENQEGDRVVATAYSRA